MKSTLIRIALAVAAFVAITLGSVQADPLPGEILKFYQTPLNNGLVLLPPGASLSSNSVPAQWPGHDELSTAYLINSNTYQGTYMADDFCDYQSTPIVHVMWWGSYINNYRGINGVTQFLITFESDVAATDTNNPFGFSHPGTNIVSQIVTLGALAPGSGTYTETFEPIGPGLPGPDGNLYQYNAELAIPVPETSNRVEWIKIVALTADPQLQWGWHNRDYGVQDPLACVAPGVVPGEFNQNPTGPPIWHFQDDAVTGPVFIQGTNVQQLNYNPTFYQPPYDGIPYSKDLAFALYTQQPTQSIPCETIKFYQVPLNNTAPVIPNGGTISQGSVPTPFPGHDELSTAYYNIDGNFYQGTFMADDFCDFLSTPIIHVTWWGSYMSNYFGSAVQQFLITFETDVASNAPGNSFGFSHPGSNIVSQIVTRGVLAPSSGTFVETPIPIGPIGPIGIDGNLFQYDAELAVPVPETSNQVEWIKIVALTTDQQLRWGWHNRDYGIRDPLACTAPSIIPGEFNANPSNNPPIWHFQDDAVTGPVFVFGGTNVQESGYQRTFYSPQYDGISYSKDLAFALYTLTPVLTFEQWQVTYFGCSNCLMAAGGADPDGDGMVNSNEFWAGTVPTSSSSYLRITNITREGPGSNDLGIVWAAQSCKQYIVQETPGTVADGSYTNNFVSIAGSLTNMPTGGGTIFAKYVIVGGATNRPSHYYRVKLIP